MPDKLKLSAQWADDFGGRKDYDAPIVKFSARYWPGDGVTASLVIEYEDPEGIGSLRLARKEFGCKSFDEVAPQVETWAQEQMDRVVTVLREAFKADGAEHAPGDGGASQTVRGLLKYTDGTVGFEEC